MSEGHKFEWRGNWGRGDVDLTKIPCASAFGVSDCFPCSILPDLKQTLVDALDLALNGRIKVTVYSSYSHRFWNLDPNYVHVDWWQETPEIKA